MNSLSTTIGRRLRQLRNSLGITQEEWEERTGVPQSTLSAWERGNNMKVLTRIDGAVRAAGGDPAMLVADTSRLTNDARQVADLYEQCDQATKDIVVGILRARASIPRSQYGIE